MDGNNGKNKRRKNRREDASLLSVATFFYVIPTFYEGYKKEFQEEDLPQVLKEHKTSILGDRIENAWNQELKWAAKRNQKPSLKRVVFKLFIKKFMLLGLVALFFECINILQPILLGVYLSYYRPGQTLITENDAYIYGAGVVLCSLIAAIVYHPLRMATSHLGMKIKVSCCSLIYRKCLRLSHEALRKTDVGQIINLLSNDVARFDRTFVAIHFVWIAPLEVAICSYLMYLEMGPSIFLGIGVIVLISTIQVYISGKMSIYRRKTAVKTDSRVKKINEILSGIQVIKMYAWEKPFAKLVALAREEELKYVKMTVAIMCITVSILLFGTSISIFATVLLYALLGNQITAGKTFVVTSFYNLFKITVTGHFLRGLPSLTEMNVSLTRINNFLLLEEELDLIKQSENEQNHFTEVYKALPEVFPVMSYPIKDKNIIRIEKASAKWNKALHTETISNISLDVARENLIVIIGPVGSGKTSLLHVILKELPLLSGKLTINGSISYASQDPWLFAGTVRQNILFGVPMNNERYAAVIKVCALERDLHLLPFSDLTIIGDRGISLSGGQRARINLARAIYREADIYLLDDPLSAVDTHVGKQLFENCIINFLKHKTIILVTHQTQYLKDADKIVYLDNGVIQAKGTLRELKQYDFKFTSTIGDNSDEKQSEENVIDKSIVEKGKESCKYQKDQEASKIIKEHKTKGSVKFEIYKKYFTAGGNFLKLSILFIFFVLTQAFSSFSDYFLAYWINVEQINYSRNTSLMMKDQISSEATNTYSRNTFVYIYVAAFVALIVIFIFRMITYVNVCVTSSKTLHNRMFNSIIKGTMRFFNTNSAGRILNRFSKDIGSMDDLLPWLLLDTLQIFLMLFAVIIVISVLNVYLLVPSIIMLAVFYSLRNFYIRLSRAIKRLEGTTRSPIFSHVSASVYGLTTIRAFGAKALLEEEFDNQMDVNNVAWHISTASATALGYWLDLVCVIYLAIISFSFLILKENMSGSVGLAITQITGIMRTLQLGIKQSAALENEMTSVERVLEYTNLDYERGNRDEDINIPPDSWPQCGNIVFKSVSLKYSPDDPPVLKDLNFTISSKEKIGIVGRTGAGKSSLINAIFQLADIEGSIIIDNFDATKVNLDILRSKISIIPQEPVIFSGTLRYNLDPFGRYSDTEIWNALEDVELKKTVSQLENNLNTELSPEGSNFSVGQKQLVCLARAILCRNKILILDEATANVDPQTDTLIQNTIRQNFADCTVLTIAHRLNTIMDSDKVLVMNAGQMKEFDHPYILLKQKDSILSGMVQQTCQSMADTLLQIAKISYHKKYDFTVLNNIGN